MGNIWIIHGLIYALNCICCAIRIALVKRGRSSIGHETKTKNTIEIEPLHSDLLIAGVIISEFEQQQNEQEKNI